MSETPQDRSDAFALETHKLRRFGPEESTSMIARSRTSRRAAAEHLYEDAYNQGFGPLVDYIRVLETKLTALPAELADYNQDEHAYGVEFS